jgi:hypothetical protein
MSEFASEFKEGMHRQGRGRAARTVWRVRIAALLLTCAAALCAAGCGALRAPWPAARLTYQDTPFRAELRGTLDGVPFRGVLEASFAPGNGGEAQLTHALTYSEPAALAGITVTSAADGTGGRALLPDGTPLHDRTGTESLPLDPGGWLAPARAFALRETLFPSEQADNAEGLTVLCTQQNGLHYTVYLEHDAVRPVRITAGDVGKEPRLDLTVVWFEEERNGA